MTLTERIGALAQAHQSLTRQDDEGWYVAICTCGWDYGLLPDAETATDFLMGHAFHQAIVAAEAQEDSG